MRIEKHKCDCCKKEEGDINQSLPDDWEEVQLICRKAWKSYKTIEQIYLCPGCDFEREIIIMNKNNKEKQNELARSFSKLFAFAWLW